MTASYCSWKAAACTQCSRPDSRPQAASRAAPTPRSVARSSSSRSSVRKPAVASAGARPGGPADGALLLGVAAQQLGDHGVLLRRGQQPGRRVAAQQRGAAQHAVGVGVEGAGQRLADGARHPAGDPGAQLGGGLAAERQDEDLLGVDAGVDPGGDRLDDRRRLPRARAGEHEQRAAGVVDDGLLGRVEPRRGGGDGARLHEPVDRRRSSLPRCATPRWKHGPATVPGRAGRV